MSEYSIVNHKDKQIDIQIGRRFMLSCNQVLDKARSMLANIQQFPEQKRAQVIKVCRSILLDLQIQRFCSNLGLGQMQAIGAWQRRMETGLKTLVILAGNQAGKSASACRIFGKHLRDQAKEGSVFWCIAPNAQKSIGTQQRMLNLCIPKSMQQQNGYTDKNGFGSRSPMMIIDRGIRKNGLGGKVIVKFKSQSQYQQDPSAFESETIDGVWVDEAVDKKIYTALLPRLLVKKGFMIFSTIPSAGWMYESFVMAPEGLGIRVVKMWTAQNPAISAQALEQMQASITDPDQYQMRINGNFKFMSGIVFRQFKNSKHMIKESDIPKDLTYYGGVDSGWTHPTTAILLGVDRQGIIYVVDQYFATKRTVAQNAKGILQMIGKRKLAASMRIDPSTGSITAANKISVLNQYCNAGLKVTKARRTQDIGQKVIVDSIRQMFSDDGLFISQKCKNLIRQLQVWSYKRNVHGQATANQGYQDKNNDMIDSLKYTIGSPIHYISSDRPRPRVIFS